MSFNGQRLKIARLYRNLSITELAGKIDVKKQAISQFENGTIRPKPDTEFAMVATLRFPRAFFHQETPVPIKGNTFFRALSSASSLDKKTQEIKTQLIVEIYNFLSNYLNFPILDLPQINRTENDIESIAMAIRDYWNIGEKPVPNMVNLVENHGIIASAFDVDSEKIDAFTQVHFLESHPQYCIVVGNNKKSAVRRNFDIAHELGHIILHSNIDNLDELSSDELKKIETEAHEFAAAFLMPKESFYRDLKTPTDIRSYIHLKRKWHVSIAAMLIRAKSLGRISINEYQSLMKSMSYRKWRTEEPLDDEIKMPVPTLFSTAIDVLFENNILTPKTFMSNLSSYGLAIPPEEVEMLLSLPKGTLISDSNIIPLKNLINIK